MQSRRWHLLSENETAIFVLERSTHIKARRFQHDHSRDRQHKDHRGGGLLKAGVYAAPIRAKGVSMVDIRDIGEAAAIELVRREQAAAPVGRETYALVGPDSLTGEGIATIWSEALGKAIRYGGDDLVVMEKRTKTMLPAWHALDLRLMFGRYQTEGAVATADDLAGLTKLLGRAPRSYAAFARDAAAQWAKG